MNVSEVKKKEKDKRIREIMRKIDRHEVKGDDEWLQIMGEMGAYAETDIAEDVKRLFYPLGYLEKLTIICDGILRWRSSICINCRKQRGYGKNHCSVYPGNEAWNGIPNKIWANENAECPYYEK